jgi:uncharacterized damage-inducible protein DinB
VAYWKYAVHRRIVGEKKGGFPRKPSDWPEQPGEPEESVWRSDRDLLRSEHEKITQLTTEFDTARLDTLAGGKNRWTYMDLLSGVILHDTYHVGQIQLMKRLHSSLVGTTLGTSQGAGP